MVQIRNQENELVDVTTVAEADRVQGALASLVKDQLASLDDPDIIVAMRGAETCNRVLEVAFENENALSPLRERAYVDATRNNANEFVKRYLRHKGE